MGNRQEYENNIILVNYGNNPLSNAGWYVYKAKSNFEAGIGIRNLGPRRWINRDEIQLRFYSSICSPASF